MPKNESKEPSNRQDWSLRASGSSYFDRDSETARLTKRITTSTASVTGIAGQRGAGKSSLVMRVLDEMKSRGAFTLLIHSPTAYDAKEFLVAVFQRCCEETIERVDRLFGTAQTIEQRGRQELMRTRREIATLIVGAIFVIAASVGVGTYFYSVYQKEALEKERIDYIAFLKEEKTRYERDFPLSERNLKSQLEDLQRSREEIKSEISLGNGGAPNDELLARLNKVDADIVRLESDLAEFRSYAEDRLNRLTAEIAAAEAAPARLKLSTLAWGAASLLGAVLFVYSLIFFVANYVARVLRRRRLARRYPSEFGLKALSEEILEELLFQTTTKSAAEAGLNLSQLSSKLSTERSVAQRPFSLPGLTAKFGDYLEELSKIYDGKVVICLDELDKIEKVEELERLLRAIKGVLGHPHTHFLLTVSEDALARFSTRRRMDRGMIESSFEEILFLHRINANVAAQILDAMGVMKQTPTNSRKSTMLWAFGAGIPREIKRGAVQSLEVGVDIETTGVNELWRSLLHSRLEALKMWGLRFNEQNPYATEFVDHVCTSLDTLSSGEAGQSSLVTHLKRIWHEFEERVFTALEEFDANQPVDAAKFDELLALDRATLEVLLLLEAEAIAHAEVTSLKGLELKLCEVFEALPSNYRIARASLMELSSIIETPKQAAE